QTRKYFEPKLQVNEVVIHVCRAGKRQGIVFEGGVTGQRAYPESDLRGIRSGLRPDLFLPAFQEQGAVAEVSCAAQILELRTIGGGHQVQELLGFIELQTLNPKRNHGVECNFTML